ncbi:MAG: inositol monophosphatase [Oscillatoriales cyanobacterium SM2_1_8]|nr:inositol monophosphatase [Oscillatoriales cyanobacterium SM2_1_8]
MGVHPDEKARSAADLQAYLVVATEAARVGGAILRQHFGKLTAATDIVEKQPGDLVTIADRESEAAILAILRKHCPDFDILAEESGQQNRQSPWLWAVDPLDGTTNFAHGYPFATVSIGLLYQGEPVVGVVYDPFHDELFRGIVGEGATCWSGGQVRSLRPSTTAHFPQSLWVSGFAYDRRRVTDNNYAEFCHFTHLTQGVRRSGSAALDLAYVAAGRFDGYWERGLSPWDLAAGVVLVRAAGGMVTAYDGGPFDLASGRILATNGLLHESAITTLAGVSPLPGPFPGIE